MFMIYLCAKIYMHSYHEPFIAAIKTKIREHFWMAAILLFYILQK
jgi:hypothetical protein